PETLLAEAQHDYNRWNNRSYGLAREKVEQALAAQPNNAIAWQLLGQLNRKVGRMEESLQAFTRAIELDPTDNLSLREGADVARWLRRYDLSRELRFKAAKVMRVPASWGQLLTAADVELGRSGDWGPLRKTVEQIAKENPGTLTEQRLRFWRLKLAN